MMKDRCGISSEITDDTIGAFYNINSGVGGNVTGPDVFAETALQDEKGVNKRATISIFTEFSEASIKANSRQ